MTLVRPALLGATYADIEAAPPHLVAELLGGEWVTHPRPSPRHASASLSLVGELVGPFQKGRGGPGGWVFMAEPELHFGSDVVVPSLASWRRETLPALPDVPYLTTPPDWVCEVLSPSTETVDRGVNRSIYAACGVSYLWLVDPRVRLLEAFALVDGRWSLLATVRDQDDVAIPPFEAAPFSLGLLWPFDPSPLA